MGYLKALFLLREPQVDVVREDKQLQCWLFLTFFQATVAHKVEAEITRLDLRDA